MNILESTGKFLFNQVTAARYLIGLLAGGMASYVSMRFNFIYGGWSANDLEGKFLLSYGYAALDGINIVFITYLFMGIITGKLKNWTIVTCLVLSTLTVWTGLSYRFAATYIKDNPRQFMELNQIDREIADKMELKKGWQEKFHKTEQNQTRYSGYINELEKQIKPLEIKRVELLSSMPAPSSIIYTSIGGATWPIVGTVLQYIIGFLLTLAVAIAPLNVTALLTYDATTKAPNKTRTKTQVATRKKREAPTELDLALYRRVTKKAEKMAIPLPIVESIKTMFGCSDERASNMAKMLESEGYIYMKGNRYRYPDIDQEG